MAIKDKLQPPSLSPKPFPSFSSKDEKKEQKKLDRLRKNKRRGFEGKTLWDWLQLLGVPILLAAATIGFSFVQFYLADRQHSSDQTIANQQHDSDQKSVLGQQQATILQTYIDNIQELLLKDNLFGNNPAPKTDADKVTIQEVRELARARTLTALQGLDPDRKSRLVQFLYEARLIGFLNDNFKQQGKIINLRGADFSGVDLSGVDLSGVDLSGVDLTFANLRGGNFSGAELSCATLTGADFTCANLFGADFTCANLRGGNFSGATLIDADFTGASLTQQQLDQVFSCKNATLPTGLICHNNIIP